MDLRKLVVLVVVLPVLLAACAAGQTSPTATFGPAVETRLAEARKPILERTPRPTSTPRKAQTPTIVAPATVTEAGPTSTLRPTATPNPLIDEMQHVLLDVDELPTGWTMIIQTGYIDTVPTENICGRDVARTAIVSAQAEFQLTYDGPFVTQGTELYGSADEAHFRLSEYRTAFENCPADGFRYEDEDIFFLISPLSFPDIGDLTFSFRMTFVVDGFGFESDVVFMQVGSVINIIAYNDLDRIDTGQTEFFVRLAETKIRSMAEYIDSIDTSGATI